MSEAETQHVIPGPTHSCRSGSGGGRGVFAEGALALELLWAEALSPGV